MRVENLLSVLSVWIVLFLVVVICLSNPVLLIWSPRMVPSLEYGIGVLSMAIGSVILEAKGMILNLVVFVLIFHFFSY